MKGINRMEEIAKKLGVEMNNYFSVTFPDGRKDKQIYVFRDSGLCLKLGTQEQRADTTLRKLLTGSLLVNQYLLDDEEKEYLEGVLRPWRKQEIKIYKNHRHSNTDRYELLIKIGEGICNYFNLPPFDIKSSMYQGMEEDRWYTKEELGLFQEGK